MFLILKESNMGFTNFPNGVTSFGVPLFGSSGSGIVTGNVFFVDSGHDLAADAGNAGQRNQPFATVDFAVGQCTANNGDVIYVLPGHAETLSAADAIDIDVASVSVIGIGNGTDRPTFTYDNAAGEIVIGADNVLVENIVCNASVTTVLIGISIEDGVDYATIRNCQFGVDATGTDEFNATIHIANNNTGTVIENCIIDNGLGAAVAGIHMDADTAMTTIRGNIIRGDYSTANIVGDTTLSTNVLIQGNILENGIGGNLNAQPGIELLTATTGTIANNYIVCDLSTKAASVVADTCLLFENYYNEDISGAATGGIIGAASADD